MDLVRWLRLYGEILSSMGEIIDPDSDVIIHSFCDNATLYVIKLFSLIKVRVLKRNKHIIQ